MGTAVRRPAKLWLRLYVAGQAPNSVRAIGNVKAICLEHFASRHRLEIVDVLQHPQRGLTDGIIVTPTLVKLLPLPVRRVVGNLSDTNQLLLALTSTGNPAPIPRRRRL
ncbi:MAG: circadian clock KaiB family protein [Acidobacteriota bacterium]